MLDNIKVLILENDGIVVDHLFRDLDRCDLIVTESAKVAIDLLRRNDYDVLYLDDSLDYPILNGSGYDVVDFLHIHKRTKKPEIMIHSHNSNFYNYAFLLLDKVHFSPIKYTMDYFCT